MSDMPFPHASNPGQPVVNRRLSQEAFRKLTSGQVINQYQHVDGELAPNPLFEELYKERDRYYVEAYANMGMELVQRPGFFFVRMLSSSQTDDDTRDQESAAAVRQIQGVLLVLGRGVLEMGYLFEALTTPQAGIPREKLEEIGSDTTMSQILAACYIDRPLPEAVKNTLVDRGIAYFNLKGNLVLADAGRAFFDDLFDQEPSDR